MKALKVLIAGMLAGYTGMTVAEEDTPNWQEETLTGDWNGNRKKLYGKGVDISLVHKSDVLSNVGGGIKQGSRWMSNTEAMIAIDFDKLSGWQGVSGMIHYHSQLGSRFNPDYVGSFNGVDNIEVNVNTAQFYQAWLQKNWLDDRFSALAGVYGLDSEFYVTNASGVFLQPPLGIGGEVAQSGVYGPAVFPSGAIGLRVKYVAPSTRYYLQAALTDGVPSNPNNPRGTHLKLGNGDGTFSIVELGYTPEYTDEHGKQVEEPPENYMHKTAFGIWRFTRKMDDLIDVDDVGNPINRTAYGAYILSEQPLYTEQKDPAQGLTGFVRLGYANQRVHQADWAASIGLQYIGLFDGRENDIAGAAASVSHASRVFRQVNQANSNESLFELTYKAQLKPWLFLQPDIQYIVNPGMDPSIKNAKIIALRVEVIF